MKIKKQLRKSIQTAVNLSVTQGKLNESVVKKYIRAFKSLSLSESVESLTLYLRGLKLNLEKSTLVIESSSPLSVSEIKEVASNFKNKFNINEIRQIQNPSLLGGIKVKIADTVYDFSVSGKINQIKQSIAG